MLPFLFGFIFTCCVPRLQCVGCVYCQQRSMLALQEMHMNMHKHTLLFNCHCIKEKPVIESQNLYL